MAGPRTTFRTRRDSGRHSSVPNWPKPAREHAPGCTGFVRFDRWWHNEADPVDPGWTTLWSTTTSSNAIVMRRGR